MMVCKRCGCEVDAHYDHVGMCPDDCDGTYAHPRVSRVQVDSESFRNRPCALSGRTIGHAHVEER